MSSTVLWAAFLQPEDPVSLLSSLQFPMQPAHTPGDSHWASANSYSSPSAQSILTSLYTSTTLACILEGCFLLASDGPACFYYPVSSIIPFSNVFVMLVRCVGVCVCISYFLYQSLMILLQTSPVCFYLLMGSRWLQYNWPVQTEPLYFS